MTTALDLEATRQMLVVQADTRGRDPRIAGDRKALRVEEGVARVRRDYVDAKLTADEWRELRDDLASLRDAARATVERLDCQRRDPE